MPQEYQHEIKPLSSLRLQGILLYILPAPLFVKVLVSLVMMKLLPLALSVAALFFFYSGARMTRASLIKIAENRQRPSPKAFNDQRPLALIYIGVGVLLLTFMIKPGINGRTLLMPLFAMLGYYLVYGIRASDDDVEKRFDFDEMPPATRKAIEGAYNDLNAIEDLLAKLSPDDDKVIIEHTEKVIAQSYNILSLLSRSPEDANRARRFLNVYINRIKEILTQYLNLSAYGKAESFRMRLINTLKETHKTFSRQEENLLDDDKFKLDVQLEVLDEQLKNEVKSKE